VTVDIIDNGYQYQLTFCKFGEDKEMKALRLLLMLLLTFAVTACGAGNSGESGGQKTDAKQAANSPQPSAASDTDGEKTIRHAR
jgi:hypothetical protein